MSLAVGTSLSRYEIHSLLGKGGMGEVYLAEDTRLRRKVALKLLPADFSADMDRLARFEREAYAASALNHPNILTIYEIGADEGQPFIATEFIEGESLRQRMDLARLELSESLEIGIQASSALAVAHAAGVVHRDIKPENIMVCTDGLVKVLDFGLAKFIEREMPISDTEARTKALYKTEAGVVMGTVAYMSPEQARGLEVDARTDVWSLGVMLYEMLTGRKPFTGDTTSDILASILHSEAVPATEFNRKIPAELERTILKTLRKDQEARYRSAQELLVDLRQLQKRLEFEAELARSEPTSQPTQAQTVIIKTEPNNSIVVLPFVNMSADVENDYFCDGLADEILNALAKIENLKVAARTSAFSFKGKNFNVSEIGRALNVKTVLEGGVRKSGQRLRITVQLISAEDGYQLWSERYDREMQDIFDVQDEITLAVVGVLKVKLFGAEKAAVLKRYTDNTEAYELYLKGRYHYHKFTGEGWKRAIEYFEEVIGKEPEYAPAYAGTALCWLMIWFYGVLPPNEIIPKWKEATDRALAMDNDLAKAHLSLANIHFFYEWKWEEAEREYERAIELNPNSADAHWWYGDFLVSRGRFDQAIDEGRRAVDLDPLSLLAILNMGWIYLFADRLDDALGQARKMIEMEPNFHGAYWQMGVVYLSKGMYQESVEAYQKAIALGGSQIAWSGLSAAYSMSGKRNEARAALDQLLEMRKHRYVAAIDIARAYSGLGEDDLAFEWMRKAVEERNGEIVFFLREIKIGTGDIWGVSFRRDPRLQELLQRIGY